MDTLELLDEVVAIGSTVVVRDLENNEVAIYTLAPPNQADISRNRISSLTPVAHALYGRRTARRTNPCFWLSAVGCQLSAVGQKGQGYCPRRDQ
jgi:hypothetical protein